MEKDSFFAAQNTALNWTQASSEMNDHLPAFLNLNWDQSGEQSATAHFESALSSLVSSPSSNPAVAGEGVVIRELIGRLGSICNSGEISPPSSRFNGNHSAGNSSYSTPLSSPPKLNLSMMAGNLIPPASLPAFSADPGFAERAARYSCFTGRSNYGQFGLPEAGKLSRASSSKSLKAGNGGGSPVSAMENGKEISMLEGSQMEMDARSKLAGRVSGPPTPLETEFKPLQEVSSVSGESNSRKRKSVMKGKGKETTPLSSKMEEEEDVNAKRCKSGENNGAEKDACEASGQKNGKDSNAKPLEPPKDYIHVRARRGQATDSHSLAERVRREKISKRMKFLQDLVPGCNKVTGKAVMLDEIINYVQSLQRQVEFLSMKLATVNPRLEFNMENFVPKDTLPVHQLEAAFSYAYQPQQGTPLQNGVTTNALEAECSMNPLESALLRRTLSMQMQPHDGFADVASQLGNFWEDDLQSVVQMGYGQNQEVALSSQSFNNGTLPTAHMKIEL
ncbi:hypothetical protein J5N97_019848 [Dioscorea zingiberensis]|uniref:BHLH domain-containing protein n=1 Tax=Dioscorea zingiberensis TaxID=325984 RepID=A0A9D5CFC9_9LILI|nr:hypothetical protein J5N97_019848 [Dioscorea zingiberensis]